MNASGLLLILAGVLVLTQVLGGDALGRLGVTSPRAAGDNGPGDGSPEARGQGGGMSRGGGQGGGGSGGGSF